VVLKLGSTSIERDAAFVLCVNDYQNFSRKVSESGIGETTALNRMLKEFDKLVSWYDQREKPSEQLWSERAIDALSSIPLEGSLVCVGYPINNQMEIVLFVNKVESVALEEWLRGVCKLGSELSISFGFNVEESSPESPAFSEFIETEDEVSIKKCRLLGMDIYLFDYENRTVFCSKPELAEGVVRCLIHGARNSIKSDRSFLRLHQKLDGFTNDSDVWLSMNPRLLQKVLPVDQLYPLSSFLPYFLEKLEGEDVSREVVGVGASLRIDVRSSGQERPSDSIDKRVPLVVVSGVALHTVPRSSYFEALHSAAKLDIPEFVLELPNIESMTVCNLDLSKVFSELELQYETIHGFGSFDKKMNELRELFRNSYDFASLYERSGHSSLGIMYRSTPDGPIQTVGVQKFKSAEDAAWFAEARSSSGFENQEYPLRRANIRGHVSYFRDKSSQKAYDEVMSTPKRVITHTAFNEWYLSCELPVAEQIIGSAFLVEITPPQIKLLLDSASNLAENSERPFYISYRNVGRWANELARLKRLLEFEQWAKKHAPPGATNDKAPRSFAERAVMSVNFWAIQIFLETCGETITIASSDDDSIRVTSAGFKSKDATAHSMLEIPSLLDFLK
jgi:hypothetical protein